jgi:hypothetical protein
MDPVQAYKHLLAVSPTVHPSQPLLSLPAKHGNIAMVTSRSLAIALKRLIVALELQPKLYSLHSLRRGGATSSYNAGVAYTDIKRHGQWKSDSFWDYIAAPCVSKSTVAAALAAAASNI